LLKFTNITTAKKLTGLSYLGSINSSAKILKNQKVSNQYTYILYLSPAQISGYNVCSHSTKECRLGCLATSGRAGIGKDNKIQQARLTKTKLFHEEQQFFMGWLIKEIDTYQKKAIKDGYGFSIRLNGTSDIDWQHILINGKNVFDTFPTVQFYDYTKNINKFKNKPTNYHLTYSYTGNNWDSCEQLLAKGHNVAMVFNKKLPVAYTTYNVVDGDLTDYRPNDGNGVIVGLKWKRISDKNINQQIKTSKFVIQ
jgi:hypothetical protein